MTITQTVDIPASRRLIIDLPSEAPTGTANVVIQFPVRAEENPLKKDSNGKIRFTRKELDEMVKNSPTLHKLAGILHTDMTVDEIRMARLAKHL